MILVDTHVIIWDALKPDLLSEAAKEAITQANETDGIIICDISLWEIAMLMEKKRLTTKDSYREFIDLVLMSNKYQIQCITPEIADAATSFPEEINNDPADRIIAATSLVLKFPLVTADRNLLNTKILNTIW